ncbi:MAG: glycosyltransferase, partial [Pricia sp.]
PKEDHLDPLPDHISEEIERNANIITTGWQKDVRPYFAITDVFVFPSYREGFPNVVLQVGAMGRYSIVTDINGSNEIIEEGLNGTIIPVKDTVALTKAMAKVIANKTAYKKVDPRYRELIGKKYGQQFVWEAQLAEYRALEAKPTEN